MPILFILYANLNHKIFAWHVWSLKIQINIISSLDADDLEPWMKWGYYVSPMSYGQNAIAINEFLDKRWSSVSFDNSLSKVVTLHRFYHHLLV